MTGTLELTQDILIFRIEQEQISPCSTLLPTNPGDNSDKSGIRDT